MSASNELRQMLRHSATPVGTQRCRKARIVVPKWSNSRSALTQSLGLSNVGDARISMRVVDGG
jgi:hypothetical protein